jgi:hypothetical protein
MKHSRDNQSQKSKDRLARGKASLDAMMETLRPFLPALDLSQPEPARKWQLTGTKCNLGNKHGEAGVGS